MNICDSCADVNCARRYGVTDCDNPIPKEIKMAEHKITSEQINTLLIVNKEHSDKLLREWFYKEFKPKQEYCCGTFKNAIRNGDIKKHDSDTVWIYGHSEWYVYFCLTCGQQPKPPIKS